MKTYLLFTFLCIAVFCFSQDTSEKKQGVFFKTSIARNIAISNDYKVDEEDLFIVPELLFFNNTIGYQFSRKTSIGLNFEYSRHFYANLNFLPVFISFRHNIWDFGGRFFLRGGAGPLINFNNFEKGNMQRVGFGFQTNDKYANNNSLLIGFDFIRKEFGVFKSEKILVASLYLEFQLF